MNDEVEVIREVGLVGEWKVIQVECPAAFMDDVGLGMCGHVGEHHLRIMLPHDEHLEVEPRVTLESVGRNWKLLAWMQNGTFHTEDTSCVLDSRCSRRFWELLSD